MKRVNDEYLKKIICVVFGLVFVISMYFVIINIRHYEALSQKVTVSDADTSYIKFKENISHVENKLNHYSDSKGTSLQRTLNVLKNGGVFHLLSHTELSYYDLYKLNDYFMNNVINDCWVSNLKGLNNNKTNDQLVNALINNSTYLDNHFINNSLTLYDSYSENSIQNDYEMILNNYLSFSDVLLSIIES